MQCRQRSKRGSAEADGDVPESYYLDEDAEAPPVTKKFAAYVKPADYEAQAAACRAQYVAAEAKKVSGGRARTSPLRLTVS
jgi:hypothetical protein